MKTISTSANDIDFKCTKMDEFVENTLKKWNLADLVERFRGKVGFRLSERVSEGVACLDGGDCFRFYGLLHE